MNFKAAYQILGTVPEDLLCELTRQIQLIQSTDYNYSDKNIGSGEVSWSRVDFFATSQPPEPKKPLFDAMFAVANYCKAECGLDRVNSASVSTLAPFQTIDEHTDGRFLHRITNRYIVPLSHSDVNYNYGYYNGEKVIYPMVYGNIYRINNAIIHAANNFESSERFNLLIDTFDERLQQKFSQHPDILAALTVFGVNKEFEKRLKV